MPVRTEQNLRDNRPIMPPPLITLAEQFDGTVVVGSHGTFICRSLIGFKMSIVDFSILSSDAHAGGLPTPLHRPSSPSRRIRPLNMGFARVRGEGHNLFGLC
jgi:hypothetical protein